MEDIQSDLRCRHRNTCPMGEDLWCEDCGARMIQGHDWELPKSHNLAERLICSAGVALGEHKLGRTLSPERQEKLYEPVAECIETFTGVKEDESHD